MKNTITLLLFFFINMAFAQVGSLDTTFNPSDAGFGNGIEGGIILETAQQPDGKIVMVGTFESFMGFSRNHITRLNADGTLDETFDPGTGTTGTGSTIYSFALQTDGKILIAGFFTAYNGTPRNNIARLNADGTLDTTFDPGTGTNQSIARVALQSDGKILIAGSFASYNGTTRNKIARLNTDGTLDPTFDPGTGASNSISSVLIRPDGKIIIAGYFISFNGFERDRIALLNADGSLDTNSNFGIGNAGPILDMKMQPDGKIIIAGGFNVYNSSPAFNVARINTDGSIDATFNTEVGANNQVSTVALQNDGKIIIGGYFSSYNGTTRNNIARLNTNGTLDLTFDPGSGTGLTAGSIESVLVKTDGKILIGGYFRFYNGISRNYLAQLNTDGVLDLAFTPGTASGSTILTMALQTDGKILIGGDFPSYNDVSRNNIARLTSDGTLDATFNSGTGVDKDINDVAVQADGKILIGGDFNMYNGISKSRIARLNNDGTLDPAFISGTEIGSSVEVIAVQPDGKILIGGTFTSYNGIGVNRIARLNTDGTLDTTFTIGTGANNAVYAIVVQEDGKIVIAGSFTFYNDIQQNRICRLNPNGSVDTTFTSGTAASHVIYAVALQTDGKIVIGGNFTSYNGTPINRLARLNTNGTLDNSFTIGTGANSAIRAITSTSVGKVIVGGNFSSFNGGIARCMTQLNNDGSNDVNFENGLGTNGISYTFATQNDGKILVGGSFVAYNQVGRNRIARIHTVESGLTTKDYDLSAIAVYPNPSSDFITFNTTVSNLEFYTAEGRKISVRYTENTADISGLPTGIYILKGYHTNGKSFTQKIIKN